MTNKAVEFDNVLHRVGGIAGVMQAARAGNDAPLKILIDAAVTAATPDPPQGGAEVSCPDCGATLAVEVKFVKHYS